LDIRPGNCEQDIVEAFGLLHRGRGRSASELRNLAGQRFWTTSASQDHFMASRQGLPCERKRDRTGADRPELHDPASWSFEKSMRTSPGRPARPTCATAWVIRDGEYRSATSNRAPGSCASRCASAISALRCSGGCCIQLPSATPLSVREWGGNRRMSLVSPPSEPKFMTVPKRSDNKSATSPNRRPPTLSIATWILAPSA